MRALEAGRWCCCSRSRALLRDVDDSARFGEMRMAACALEPPWWWVPPQGAPATCLWQCALWSLHARVAAMVRTNIFFYCLILLCSFRHPLLCCIIPRIARAIGVRNSRL